MKIDQAVRWLNQYDIYGINYYLREDEGSTDPTGNVIVAKKGDYFWAFSKKTGNYPMTGVNGLVNLRHDINGILENMKPELFNPNSEEVQAKIKEKRERKKRDGR